MPINPIAPPPSTAQKASDTVARVVRGPVFQAVVLVVIGFIMGRV